MVLNDDVCSNHHLLIRFYRELTLAVFAVASTTLCAPSGWLTLNAGQSLCSSYIELASLAKRKTDFIDSRLCASYQFDRVA